MGVFMNSEVYFYLENLLGLACHLNMVDQTLVRVNSVHLGFIDYQLEVFMDIFMREVSENYDKYSKQHAK